MHCGWLERHEWLPLPWEAEEKAWPRGGRVIQSGSLLRGSQYAMRDPDSGEVFPNVCPGYAARLPIVGEVAQAHTDYEKGCLEAMQPRLSKAVADGIRELVRGINDYQAQEREAAELKRDMERAARKP